MKNLMIVDMQKGLLNKNNSFLINKINAYLKEEKFNNIFYTRFYNHDESPYVKFLSFNKMKTEEEVEIAVDAVDDSIIFPKCSYGLANEQIKWLKEKQIKSIVLCGTDIDACILAIAFNLFDCGIKPYFKWDLCFSANHDMTAKERVKPLLIRNFGKDCII